MQTHKAPWYAAIVLAVLAGLANRYPELKEPVFTVVQVLMILWFGHTAQALHDMRQNGSNRST